MQKVCLNYNVIAVVSVCLNNETTSSLRSLAICASKLVNGSSKRMTSGMPTSAMATLSFLLLPPEEDPH